MVWHIINVDACLVNGAANCLHFFAFAAVIVPRSYHVLVISLRYNFFAIGNRDSASHLNIITCRDLNLIYFNCRCTVQPDPVDDRLEVHYLNSTKP